MSGRLTDGFRDIIEMRWSEFVELEDSVDSTNFDAIVCSVARAASKGNLRAIQTALDRLDGKIAMEIELEYPKFYTVYPNAKIKADDPGIIEGIIEENGGKVITASTPSYGNDNFQDYATYPADIEEVAAVEEELPTGSLRTVLERMLDAPKATPLGILQSVKDIDAGDPAILDPKVKSVIVAGLMKLVHEGRMSAVFEAFDQIDGKVADKVKVIDDTYLINYAEIAPAEAIKNKDGVYQVEAEKTTKIWELRLEKINGRR